MKVLDGRPVNGKFWVFYNGLTDFEFDVVVTDTTTGTTKTFNKDGGSACAAFDTEPF